MKNYIFIFVILILLNSCSNQNDLAHKIAHADCLMEEKQDSVQATLFMLDSIKPQVNSLSKKQQMYYYLIYAKGMNKAYINFNADSTMGHTMEIVVKYYDQHGSANEKMLANYLLGCVYRDKGESPIALDYYQKAIESADTTNRFSNFSLIGRIHSAMGLLYSENNAPLKTIKEEKLAEKYGWLAKDTALAIWSCEKQVSGYYQLGELDSVLAISLKAYYFCKNNGMNKEMYNALNPIIDVYVQRKDYINAGRYIHILQQSPYHFQTPDQVRKGYELLYYNIGRYYCGIGKVDDAIACFRKILAAKPLSFMHQEAAYGGLHTAYQTKFISDSIAKYAQLYVNANDSAHVHTSEKEMYRIQAMYDFQHRQKELFKTKEKNQHLTYIIVFCILATIIALISIYTFFKIKNIQAKNELIKMNIKYCKNLDEYRRSKKELAETIKSFEQQKGNKNGNLSHKLTMSNKDKLITGKENKEQALLDSSIVNQFHDYAQQIKYTVTGKNWESLINEVKKDLPNFVEYISAIRPRLTESEMRIAILIKLHFIPSEMAVLLSTSPQRITNIRTNLNKKLFNGNSTKTLDFNIRKL